MRLKDLPLGWCGKSLVIEILFYWCWNGLKAKNSLRYVFAICFWNFLRTESFKLCTFHLNLFNLNFRNLSNLNFRNLSIHNSRNLSNIYCKSIGPETYYKSLRNKQSFQCPWWPLPRKGNPLLMTRRNDRTLTLMNLNTLHMTLDTWHLTQDTWYMTHDTWHMTHDTWHMTLDTRHLTHDTWHMTLDTWHLTLDTWHMTLDTWQMTLSTSNKK